MSNKFLENKVGDAQDTKEGKPTEVLENSYQRYVELGGIINEQDYQSALERAKHTTTINENSITWAKEIAETSGIVLHNSEDFLDPRVILFGILRSDITSKEEAEYHHSNMSDQRLFAEVLRMLGDADSLKKLIEAHPHISFN